MFYPKVRHVPSDSLIDISFNDHLQNVPSRSTHRLPSPSSNLSYNQNRAQPSRSFSRHRLCHGYSDDSLDKDFLRTTKQTFDKLFHQTNFNELLDQVQHTLQPIVGQLREQIERRKHLSREDRLRCLKSCAKFITETLRHERYELDDYSTELYHLQRTLQCLLPKQQANATTQTSGLLILDMKKLKIDDDFKRSTIEKQKKPSKVSFPALRYSPPSGDDLLDRQKNYHRSVSRAFQKLNADLQKMNHETPFQAHLSKYHKHNHQ